MARSSRARLLRGVATFGVFRPVALFVDRESPTHQRLPFSGSDRPYRTKLARQLEGFEPEAAKSVEEKAKSLHPISR